MALRAQLRGPRWMRRLSLPAAVLGVVFATSCREPTSVLLEARTNVGHRAGMSTAFTVGGPGSTENAEPTTVTTTAWAADGFVGSLTVVPGGDNDAILSIKVVMGIGRDPRDCSNARPERCIVARRRLRYRPHERVVMPVLLYAECEGVACSEDTTCSALGRCVDLDWVPDCSGADCFLPGKPNDVPEGGPIGVDGPTRPDAFAGDGAMVADTGKDAPADAGVEFPSNTIGCGAVGRRCNLPMEQCCWNDATKTGSCATAGGPCVAPASPVRCDSRDDCSGGYCCAFGGNTTACTGPCSGETVCTRDGDCSGGRLCTTPYLNTYTCQ